MESPLPITSLSQLVLAGGIAYFPLFVLEYALLDQFRDNIAARRSEGIGGLLGAGRDSVYDFVVVGAGSTGAVVANRLAENYSVLLLEAGGDPNPLMAIPALASLFPNQLSVDWAFKTTPQKHACQSLINKQSLWPRGKGLGGTSNLNFMAYIRGHRLDYDNWANLTGDDRWSYVNVLPYFKKSENYHPRDTSPAARSQAELYHGFDGELNVEPLSWSPLTPYFLEAARELGYPTKDLNAAYVGEGFSEFDFTQKDGRRWGAYQAFLQNLEGAKKDRLTIHKYSAATKVVFKEGTNTVIGVEYRRHGRLRRALASKEVILSAGTIGSPKILLASGVGPEGHLKRVKVKPRLNLPGVGRNLQDHVIGLVGPFTVDKPLTFLVDRDNSPLHLIRLLNGTGPLTSSGILATGFINSRLNRNGNRNDTSKSTLDTWPDIQMILMGLSLHRDGPQVLSSLFNLDPNITEEYYRPIVGRDSFHIMSLIARPKSRGYIELRTSDPDDPPIINPNYLSNPEDMETIVRGVRKVLQLVETTKAFRSINARLSPVAFPPCASEGWMSDDYWRCYVRHYTLSVYHPVGTCAMGVSSKSSVVDSKLQVHGVENLRVIDASVQPQIVSSNIQAACTMIGELGADFVKEKWAAKDSTPSTTSVSAVSAVA